MNVDTTDGAQAADLLQQLDDCRGLVGVEVRYSDVRGYRHVLDPQTGAWWLLPAVDLPRWVRRRARPRRGRRLRIGSRRRGGVVRHLDLGDADGPAGAGGADREETDR